MTRKLFRRNFHTAGNTEYLCIHDNADLFFVFFSFFWRCLDKQTSLICNETRASSSCYPLRSDQLIYFVLNTDWASHRFCFFFFLMHSSPPAAHFDGFPTSRNSAGKPTTDPIVYCQDAELFYYYFLKQILRILWVASLPSWAESLCFFFLWLPTDKAPVPSPSFCKSQQLNLVLKSPAWG